MDSDDEVIKQQIAALEALHGDEVDFGESERAAVQGEF